MAENILLVFIGFGITLIMYLVITCYRWQKLKCHVIEAIDVLNLWDTVITRVPLPCDAFQSIITFLNDHNYTHCFNEPGGAFKLFYMLAEIRNKCVQEEA